MMGTVTLKLSERLDCRLTALAKRQRTSRAQVLREALEAFIAHSPPLTFGELAADLIIDDSPGDLSTNLKHMAGYGR
jgi:predicted DNA-binding protein